MMLVISMTLAGSAGAASGPSTLELNGGYAKSTTELGTTTEKMGGGVAIGAAYWGTISPTISWGAEVSYDNLGNVDAAGYDPFSGVTYAERFSTKILRVNPALRVSFGPPTGTSFFVQGGAGLYSASWKYNYVDDTGIAASANDSKSKFGFNAGIGIAVPAGQKTKVTFGGAYHLVGGNDVNMSDMNYIQFRAGVGLGL